MKISVLIIAHNEEKYIAKCIESILHQTRKADEIVLIAHNSTDQTVEIAKRYPFVRIVEYTGPAGQPYARIKGFNEVNGDYVCCIDGDAYAEKHWLNRMVNILYRNADVSIVAGRLVMDANIFWRISMLWQFFVRRKYLKDPLAQFASGANFACRLEDYRKVGGVDPIIDLKEELNLNFWAEDYYLSQALQTICKIHFALNAVVYTNMSPEQSSVEANMELIPKWNHDNRAILEYFKNKEA
jgi:glycosyltransferase involved in cell wall biosynthesis